jgi:hypothetical protein
MVISNEPTDELNPGQDLAEPVLLADNSVDPSAADPGSMQSQQNTMAVPASKMIKEKERDTGKSDRKSKIRGANPKKNGAVMINPVFKPEVPAARQAVMPITVNALHASPLPAGPQEELAVIATVPASGIVSPATHEQATADQDTPASGPDMLRGQEKPRAEEPGLSGIKSDYGANGDWMFGLYFTPEMIAYPSDDRLTNYSYSLDLNASYKFGRYFLQSGLGLSRNHDQGNSMIDYNKYLGSYEDVYNITFDSTENGIVPIYHTETVHVYDSTSHVIISPTKRYFTYLQVPLFLGFGEEAKRFGWFVKGGPSLSFLVHEKIPSSEMENSKDKVANIENELPGRISTNWQFIVSAGATYKLGSRMSISMEPMFRYYIKSVYEQDKLNTKHPFSVGLRTGLLVSF